jgi:saccharopine dehydrogenase (NAD+, L-lysine-forming)
MKSVYIRDEIVKNEFRTPIVPDDVRILIKNGIKVYVQSSQNRCFTDSEYKIAGAKIVTDHWSKYKQSFIIGIKELDNRELLDHHTHIYFAHCYKNQPNSKKILTQFCKSKSTLYDLEYFTDSADKRIIAFGYYAGFVGAALGLLQYSSKINRYVENPDADYRIKLGSTLLKSYSNDEFSKSDMGKLAYWNSIDNMLSTLKYNLFLYTTFKIAIIGSNGRCGRGVKDLLDKLGLLYNEFNSNSRIENLEEYDIVYNCIQLTKKIPAWFDYNTVFKKEIVVIDISCDVGNPNNPIAIDYPVTNWTHPVFHFNHFVDIIAIDNLPSLLPIESSQYFSNILIRLLIEYFNGDKGGRWKKNNDVYLSKIVTI